MPLHIILQSDITASALSIASLKKRAERLLRLLSLEHSDLSIVLMNDAEMSAFNSRYRNRKGPTNVLSFPARDDAEALPFAIPGNELGDILISVETADREATLAGKSLNERLIELIVHGLLHLLGHDHERSEEEASAMWDQEQKLLDKLNQFGRNTMAHLAINVDHVATIREARGTSEPDPVLAAGILSLIHISEPTRPY